MEVCLQCEMWGVTVWCEWAQGVELGGPVAASAVGGPVVQCFGDGDGISVVVGL